MELVTETEMRARLAELVEESVEVRMAVAFWGEGGLDKLKLTAETTKIICNLARGATNPHEIDKIRKAGIEVFQHDDLHAKVYLFNRAALIGSSNASANGLAYQGEECRGWVEANVLLRDAGFLKALRRWFDQLWKKAHPISDDDITRALEEWSKRRSRLGPRQLPSERDLLKAIGRNPNAFGDRRQYIAVCSSRMDEEGNRLLRRVRRRRNVGYQLGGFQEWEELPDDPVLVSFYFGPRGGLVFNGFWRMPEHRDEARSGDTKVQFCWKLTALDGFAVADPNAWREPLERLKKSEAWDEDGAACIDLGEFGRRFVANTVVV